MRIVFIAVLIAGLGLAGFAVFMARDYIDSLETDVAAAPAVPMTEVIAVKRDIEYGEPLTTDDLQYLELPTAVLPEVLFPQGYDVPRIVIRTMQENEPVLLAKVTDAGQDAGVATRLSPGMRAFAISVDVASGVSGFLRPNDEVDLFWTGIQPNSRREVTKLIDTNVRVVAVDQSADTERTGATVARTITVEATPRQVAAFAQAQSSGRLSMALVGALDDVVSQAVEIDQRELLGIEEETRAEAPVAPKTCTIRTRRGAEVVEIPIPCTEG